jgi:2'-hydroxyisoflavone reductase
VRILVLGGTSFLGRHVVEAALAGHHEVTLFNRGLTNPDLYPETEKLHGDRAGDLAILAGRTFDVVIDTSGQLPRHVKASAGLLAEMVSHYTFVSSISAYADFSRPVDESAPVAILEDPDTEDDRPENYGGHKALCEQAAEAALPGRTLVVRPGLIVGPYDPTDRFTYWPHRIAMGGEVLAPQPPDGAVQYIDARDLAAWMLDMAERRGTGTYNATGPETRLAMSTLLDACKRESDSDVEFTWVSEQFLNDHEVKAWSDLPLYVPPGDPSFANFLAADCRKAIAAGLRFRPLAETIRDTLSWAATRPAGHTWKAGITREREQALLESWASSSSSSDLLS